MSNIGYFGLRLGAGLGMARIMGSACFTLRFRYAGGGLGHLYLEAQGGSPKWSLGLRV